MDSATKIFFYVYTSEASRGKQWKRHAGYKGMPSFKIRPKAMSMHGRQLCIDPRTGRTVFSVAKVSRIKTMSLRHNLEVCVGDSSEEVRARYLL